MPLKLIDILCYRKYFIMSQCHLNLGTVVGCLVTKLLLQIFSEKYPDARFYYIRAFGNYWYQWVKCVYVCLLTLGLVTQVILYIHSS